MAQNSFQYFDPNLANAHAEKRMTIYDFKSQTGLQLGMHPMLENNIQLDANRSAEVVAWSTDLDNRINGWVNGVVDKNGGPWSGGGVAEGSTVFYLPETNRYYLLYARNTWDSSAYQIVYRMTEPGQPLSSLELDAALGPPPNEHVLLRSDGYAQVNRANFGGCKAFKINDASTGQDRQYIIFNAKLDYYATPGWWTGFRTVFFKEITVENVSTGKLLQLSESSSDPRSNVDFFTIPVCRD